MLSRRDLLGAVLATLGGCRRAPSDGPLLVVEPRRDATSRGVSWLVVGSFPRDARELAADRLETIADALEARVNPLAADLEEIDVERAISDARPAILPMITAARRLGASTFPMDAERSVRIARTCARPDRCVPAWGPSDDDDAPRLRFAAWPVAEAVVLRASGAEMAERAAEAVRRATADARSPIALVVDHASLVRRPEGLERFARAAERCARLLRSRREDAAVLAPLASVEPPRLEALGLGDEDVLVVPKLGALAERARFRAAVSERLTAAAIERGMSFRT